MTNFPDVAVVGMHFRGSEVKALVAGLEVPEESEPPLTFRLEREPANLFDANAIKVFFESTHIGYIERGQAAFIAYHMDEGRTATCILRRMEERTTGKAHNIHPICEVNVAD